MHHVPRVGVLLDDEDACEDACEDVRAVHLWKLLDPPRIFEAGESKNDLRGITLGITPI